MLFWMINTSSLFHLECNKCAMIREMGVWEHGVWKWVWRWRRGVRGRALGDFEELLSLIREVHPIRQERDKWISQLDEDGDFTVKRLKELIDI